MATTSLLTGSITFNENHLSALLAGEYSIEVQQHVENTNKSAAADKQFNEKYVNKHRFAVTAPRFSVPPAAIYNVFPPKDNRGEYDNVLPHVVLSSPALPWLRTPDGGNDSKPWLAVLLFEQAELDAARAAGRPVELEGTQRVGDFQPAPFKRAADAAAPSESSLPADTVSYPGLDAEKPDNPVGDNGLDYGEHWYDACRAIDVPIDLFNAIAPASSSEVGPEGKGDLELLAHSRTVATSAVKTEQGGAGTNEFSVIVCNRMPIANTRCTAHLVSLENLGNSETNTNFLPTVDAEGNYQPGRFPAGKEYVRLASLHRWSFTSVDPKETFTQYLEHLDVGPLRIPADGSNPDVAVPLALGYTALDHRTRQGDKTVSWYRGPFVPIAEPALFEPVPDPEGSTITAPLLSADQALRYNPDTGMLDVSYAAAWKLGQLLGVQNKAFSQALYNWKRVNTQKTVLSLERRILREKTGTALQGLGEGNHDTASLHAAAAALLAGPLKAHLQTK